MTVGPMAMRPMMATGDRLARLADHLARGHRTLRLSQAAPDRVPGFDTLVLTASGPAQAALYRDQLARLVKRGRLGCRTLVVPDPEGRRVGSGGATLAALGAMIAAGIDPTVGRTLLVHAGGDAKRLPWSSVLGKVFIPVPLHAVADEPAPTLLEAILAVMAPLPSRLPAAGLVVVSGDVLPLWDADLDLLSGTDLTLVVTPASAAVASRHGVVVLEADGLVQDLVQKARAESLRTMGALDSGGRALIDTGIVVATGRTLAAWTRLARTESIRTLLDSGQELSLYEEFLAGAVPARKEWLATRPLGPELDLPGVRLRAVRVEDFGFVHLGTSTEYLQHASHHWQGAWQRRVLATGGSLLATSATVLASELAVEVPVGEGSLVASSLLGHGCTVGRRSIVSGVDARLAPVVVGDHQAVWQVPVAGGWATCCCGVDDNPKDLATAGTFLGRAWRDWLTERGLGADDIWPDQPAYQRCLWTAKLFPVLPGPSAAVGVAWLLDADAGSAVAALWRQSQRISLAEAAAGCQPGDVLHRQAELTRNLALDHLHAVVRAVADRPVAHLAGCLDASCRPALAALADRVPTGAHSVPASRRHRMRADLLEASGQATDAQSAASAAWQAVADELDAALPAHLDDPVLGLPAGSRAGAALPVRFDLAGGWSDTPPICLERPAAVCNLAIFLDNMSPVRVEVESLAEARWLLQLDGGPAVAVDDPRPTGGLADPLALPKVALAVAGFARDGRIIQGVHLHASSNAPKGSGLGGSSILAAAMIQALARLSGRDDRPARVANQVLAVEQRLGTRGGWQDQLGGLVPGAKLLTSLPCRPLQVTVQPIPLPPLAVAAIEDRLVVAYTGVSRLARNVLERVVQAWLAREPRVVTAIQHLVDLAESAREALGQGDWDGLGSVLAEVWHYHQQLDPHCSHPAVDRIFHAVADLSVGGKLAGAGGGGFIGFIARPDRSDDLRRRLATMPGVTVARWSLAT